MKIVRETLLIKIKTLEVLITPGAEVESLVAPKLNNSNQILIDLKEIGDMR